MSNEDVLLSRDCVKRIMRDVKTIYKNPLDDNGIFYKHDENNILKGYAMIIGPEKTPYENGFYFFKFDYSSEYPYKPPTVTFIKNPYYVRFHPNFYRNGKVCLSLLNTWRGEQWTSCQTISTILLTITSVMNDYPLTNEPGISKYHKDNQPFNSIIRYQNINFSIIDIINNEFDEDFHVFKEIIKKFKDNQNKIEDNLKKLIDEESIAKTVTTSIYNMNVKIDYNILNDKYNNAKEIYLTEN